MGIESRKTNILDGTPSAISPIDRASPRGFTEVALEFAGRQFGVVSRRQLVSAGLNSRTISHRIATSFLFPVFTGVYVVGRRDISREGLWLASLLSTGDGAVLGGRSAATAWGFMDEVNLIDVVRVGGGPNQRPRMKVEGQRGWPYVLVRRVRSLPTTEVASASGIPVTSVARTLLDLAELLPETRFRRAFMEADRLGLLVEEELLEMARRINGRKGGRLFLRSVEDRNPDIQRARSILEGMLMTLRVERGIPRPESNVMVLGAEADFVWRELRLVVEVDGYEFHRGREAFEKDAARGNKLRSEGWTLLRFTWRMVNQQPEEVSTSLLRALTTGDSIQR